MADKSSAEDKRGRQAEDPRQVPASGWRDVMLRVKDEISSDTISLIAAGVAFYSFLSIFPAAVALVSIYGLVADPGQISQQVGALSGTVPPSALQLIQKQLSAIAGASGSALGIGLVISIVVALYSSSKGIGAFITALNVAYDEDEKRGFIKLTALTLALTLAAVLMFIVLLFVIGLPGYLAAAGLPAWLDVVIRVARWLLVFGLMIVVLAGVYAFAPSRTRPQLQWASPGAIFAIVVWLLTSIAFSFYIGHFGSYNKTYGSAAAIVILMTWFWISAFVVLIGAEINTELEGQTRRDSTAGHDRSKNNRGAAAADSVKPVP